MDTVIGLGAAGCNIADEFKKYPQYDVYKIDVGLKGEKCFNFPPQSSIEDFEKNCPSMTSFFSEIDGEILFIVSGGGKISAACLKILSHVKNHDINVLYIKPAKQDLSTINSVQEKLVFNVLQEYARSGLFKKMYIISNEIIENIIGDVPVLQYNKKINEFIVTSIHYLNIFKNTEAVLNNSEDESESSRIATIGILNIDINTENYFYNIKHEKNKIYYFAFPEKILNSDGKLIKNIRDIVAKNSIKSSYQIHCTKHENPFCYFISFSNIIQDVDN